ncbi:hypothetical protein BCV72DRAFT_337870 [Rhizopus microsporus var. microsporus]|uniref:Uncharacterized protein n=2 Tax=Rhizopus microsporus TaxID=58291 RepID=A0A2G4SI78_RHIZD|nr:uncharacterized protein RHIMIDRAFT_295047 [Rhizopus microsporus ATCC 52813]ORE03625.1 hypothetical protein BCV72DRAFT_337870 [Rhizopus microsporus var. microsporus]PHZ08488.1 hypothetical protein RHIMIDRAFT_295047 [Rhizopus microsporus ATCC 52813]
MNSSAVNNNIMNLVQDDFKDMNVEFSERFDVDCEYISIAEARSAAADFVLRLNGTDNILKKDIYNIKAQTLVCNHRKRRLRLKGQKNAAQHCLDNGNHVICRTSECPERKPSSFPPAIYQLKYCKLCPVANGQDIVWQRDINAAINIRSMLVSCIESGYKILSTYLSLTREGASGGEGATVQSLWLILIVENRAVALSWTSVPRTTLFWKT